MMLWGLYIMSAVYIIAGVLHFVKPGFYRPLMPTWIPKHDLMIFLSGIAEIFLGVLLLWPPLRAWAAWGVIALLVAVSPVHIYMIQESQTKFKKISKPFLYGRLVFQLVLIGWAYLYT